MNKKRRGTISKLSAALSDIAENVRSCYEEECEVRDNTPDGLQSSDRYIESETACENMETAIENIEEAINLLEEIV